MEATDLLAREEEFKKLNKQLEKKTESLMKQIEHAMVCFFHTFNLPVSHNKTGVSCRLCSFFNIY